uniref:Transmembrane protein n=1 Tax=Lactuca sativa TaxID=4236 RepID=A0A9R1VYH5_LACSA|nr:hypothetical protein LSAT_V11C400221750 [Lactuca sativa]
MVSVRIEIGKEFVMNLNLIIYPEMKLELIRNFVWFVGNGIVIHWWRWLLVVGDGNGVVMVVIVALVMATIVMVVAVTAGGL